MITKTTFEKRFGKRNEFGIKFTLWKRKWVNIKGKNLCQSWNLRNCPKMHHSPLHWSFRPCLQSQGDFYIIFIQIVYLHTSSWWWGVNSEPQYFNFIICILCRKMTPVLSYPAWFCCMLFRCTLKVGSRETEDGN